MGVAQGEKEAAPKWAALADRKRRLRVQKVTASRKEGEPGHRLQFDVHAHHGDLGRSIRFSSCSPPRLNRLRR